MKNASSRGSIMLLIIIFGAVFFTILVALSGFVLAQNRLQEVTRGRGEAFAIAEAGLDYYRWFLSHFPGNTTSGTGHAGPYVSSYSDPESGASGTYSLSVVGNSSCGTIQSIDVTSTGVPSDVSTVSSTVWARYAQPSIARYSMIVGASTWFDGTVFHGPMHSNGGLRMDNTSNNSSVSSSLTSWTCDASFGCSSRGQTVAGIFGNGGNQNLWSYPTPQLDFAAISSNFSSLKTTAQANGLYYPRLSTSSGKNPNPHLGYHLIFNGNSTVTVKKVTAVNMNLDSVPVDGSTGFSSMTNDYSLISSETTLGTYSIPSECGIIFVEDNAWIEGSIDTKVTIVAANVTNQGIYPTIVLPNNLIYTVFDGTAGLTAIASDNILIGPNTPQDLTLDGIFVAQSGAFGRNLYDCTSGSGGSSYQYRGKLTMLGSIVSMIRQNNYWIGTCNGSQGSWSGYPDSTWNFVFDRQNSTNPPPFTPTTSTQWQFVDWRQQ
ncbi:MAG: hypothetical protein NTV60_01555 [Candidatus Kaiserbacteria bacterium]|nr:hypothetical protein [Candidatus Kaiserbacteria bacterium]